MDSILLAVLGLLTLGSFVCFIIVLVKLFKKEGVLKGILGIICGLYPFIWGWIKHKQLELTKIMALWTGVMLASVLLQTFFAATAFQTALTLINPVVSSGPAPPRKIQRPVRRPPPRPPRKPAAQKPSPEKPQVAATAPDKGGAGNQAAKKSLDFEFELKRVNSLLQLNEDNADALFNRGWLYEVKGDLKAAEKDYTEAIRVDKKHADAYYNRGLLYVKAKQYDLAVKDFSEAIRLNARAFDAYCNRGNAYVSLGKNDLAISDYTQALKINPNDSDLYYNRGLAYAANGAETKALNDFKKAANLGHQLAKDHLRSVSARPEGLPSQKKKESKSDMQGT